MLIISAKLSKKKLALAGLLLALLAIPLLTQWKEDSPPADPISGETDQQRVDYLASLGWLATQTPAETLEFTLPDPLGDTYETYNQLQLRQGFDLTPYAGRQIKRFSYPISNHPESSTGVQADLYVCDGVVIAGDILRTGPNSSISTLHFPD